jgi:hypothetical protein
MGAFTREQPIVVPGVLTMFIQGAVIACFYVCAARESFWQ